MCCVGLWVGVSGTISNSCRWYRREVSVGLVRPALVHSFLGPAPPPPQIQNTTLSPPPPSTTMGPPDNGTPSEKRVTPRPGPLPPSNTKYNSEPPAPIYDNGTTGQRDTIGEAGYPTPRTPPPPLSPASQARRGNQDHRPRRLKRWFLAQRPSPCPSPCTPTKGTSVGNNEMYRRENLIGPFLVQILVGPRPPPPSLTGRGVLSDSQAQPQAIGDSGAQGGRTPRRRGSR